jgi:hypothetical protein
MLDRACPGAADPGEVTEEEFRLGTQAGGAGGRGLARDLPRAIDVPGREKRLGLSETSARRLILTVWGSQPLRCRKELGRGLLCASPCSQRGARLELCGDFLIRFCRAERQVASPLFRIRHHKRETLVQLPPPFR